MRMGHGVRTGLGHGGITCGAGVPDFFYYESKFKIKKINIFFFGTEGEGGGGRRGGLE